MGAGEPRDPCSDLNLIPLPAAAVEIIYGTWWGTVVEGDVGRSAARYARAVS